MPHPGWANTVPPSLDGDPEPPSASRAPGPADAIARDAPAPANAPAALAAIGQPALVATLKGLLPAHALLWHAEDTTPYELSLIHI